ncbi:uncharacterized protein LOC144622007 [Crassostrea virginica]
MEFNVMWLLMAVFLGCISHVEAITCYACNSNKDSNCGEQFIEWKLLSDRFKVSGCAACGKYVVKKSETITYVQRSCVSTARHPKTCTDNEEACFHFCHSDLCNGQGRISLSTPLILLTALVVLLQRLLGSYHPFGNP